MTMAYIKLGVASVLPVVLSLIFYILDKKTFFSKAPKFVKQIIYGVFFGALAILGTEWGIPLEGAMVNCRDGAVITAGLLFGSPAGIIAGLIGGVERYFAVAWGVGSYTRIACSVSTIIAGIYAALLRKYMFEDKKPGWILSLAIGVVMEVLHLTMVFITNMDTADKAMTVVRVCSIPMILANGLAVMLATIVLSLAAKENKKNINHTIHISQKVQRWLFLAVFIAFTLTSYFVITLQDNLSQSQTQTILNLATEDVSSDILDASDKNLLNATRIIKSKLGTKPLAELAKENDVAEISLINQNGIIIESSEPTYLGFDMNSGSQAREFLCLLGDKEEYVQPYGEITSDRAVSRKYAGIKLESGFLQVGYNASQFQDDIAEITRDLTANRHVGETGYLIIFDEENNIVSSPKDFDVSLISKQNNKKTQKENELFNIKLGDTDCIATYQSVEGFYLFAIMPKADAFKSRNIAVYVNTFMEILVFALLFAFIYFIVKRVIVNQIKKINVSLAKITGGDLSEVVNVRTSEEFVSLSDDINSTVATLKDYIAEASARIDKELEFAKNIQLSALPSVFPAFPKRKEIDIFADMRTAKEVGGDFYDFYFTHSNIINFLIADVSGKGIPAAMFMMRAKTELKSLTETDLPLDNVFTNGNNALCEGNDAGMFVTAWQGAVDLNTGVLSFVNAGHNPPLLKRKDGKFEFIKSPAGFILAGMEGVKYKPNEITLQEGDIIYLYTDGVTEATNKDEELYGENRLLSILNSKDFEDMNELCDCVKKDVDDFVGDAPQFDDITMLAFKYIGKEGLPHISFDRASIEDIPAVTEFIEEQLNQMDCPMKTTVQINVAIDEIYSNIAKFAYPDGKGPVTVTISEYENPHYVKITFEDKGMPYNPLTKEDPDVTLSAEERDIGGLGIYMVKKTMDEMKYKYENETNILTIIKNL